MRSVGSLWVIVLVTPSWSASTRRSSSDFTVTTPPSHMICVSFVDPVPQGGFVSWRSDQLISTALESCAVRLVPAPSFAPSVSSILG